MSTLKQRVITAAVAIPAGLYLVLYGSKTTFGLTVVLLSLIGLDEFLVMGITSGFRLLRWPGMLAGLAVSLSFLPFKLPFNGLILASAGFFLMVVAIYQKDEDRKEVVAGASVTLLGVILINWFLGHIIWIRGLSGGTGLLVYTLLLVWANDTAAYFTGSAYGKNKMAPSISPNKSWEGFAGGLAGSLLLGISGASLAGIGYKKGLLAGLLVGLIGPAGDLTQSYIKRTAGVKDSGKLFPGHGGVLDRFDSFIMVAPFLFHLFLKSCFLP